MGTIALIFDTEGGNTNRVAVLIARHFPKGTVDVYSAAQLNAALIARYTALIVGSPSMDGGALADNWQQFVEGAGAGLDFTGKKVALFALGDQVGYPDAFVDGLGVLYETLLRVGATIVGTWPTEGYRYRHSRAEVDGQFVGLVIDQENQPELTDDRIARWTRALIPVLSAGA
jgi:flavodoxin I